MGHGESSQMQPIKRTTTQPSARLEFFKTLTAISLCLSFVCSCSSGGGEDTPSGNTSTPPETQETENTTTPSEAPPGTTKSLVYAFNVGGEPYTADDGTEYTAEPTNYLSMTGDNHGTTDMAEEFTSTVDGVIYQTQRYGLFSYELPVSNGTYEITVQMSEHWAETESQRLINIYIEDTEVLSNLDLIAEVGKFAVYDQTFTNISVTDGALTLRFDASENLGTVSGIRIYSSNMSTPTDLPEVVEPTVPSEPSPPATPEVTLGQGQDLFEQHCIACHKHQGNGVFGVGGFSFNINALTFAENPRFSANYDSSTVEGLASFIHNEMPSPGVCTDTCSEATAAYLWSFITSEPQGQTPTETAGSCESQNALMQPQLRRLSQAQIQNSITDIFGDIFNESDWVDMQDGGALLGMSYSADRLQINSINMENLYRSSRLIVTSVMTQNNDIQECSQAQSASCVTTLAAQFGLKLWRRPLSQTELSTLQLNIDSFTGNTEKLEYTLNFLLLNHRFLFRSELGDVSGDISVLNNYELVSILSYSIWNSTPDSSLLSLASQQLPLTDNDIITQVERMLADPKTNNTILEIYKDYLKLDLVLTQEKLESLNFTQAMREDALLSAEMMLQEKISSNQAYMSIFTGNDFYINSNIQSLFGLDNFPAVFETASIAADEREGILNHPAFLAGHSTLASSGIVQRGVFTLEQLLCNDIPKAPDDVSSIAPPDDVDPATTSTRELLQITHSAQTQCRSCHQFIDPAGFGYENFDNLGRYRTMEKGTVPIDASGELVVGNETLSYNNSAHYSRELTSSSKMRHCVSRRFLEHYVGKPLAEDSCELETYQSILNDSDQSVRDFIYSLIKLESFSRRNIEQ